MMYSKGTSAPRIAAGAGVAPSVVRYTWLLPQNWSPV